MSAWTFYPAFLGTLISITAWSYLVYKEYLPHLPGSLSHLAADKAATLKYFRIVLWICGPLFAITMFKFVVGRIDNSLAVLIVCICIIAGEMLSGIFPAKRDTFTVHDVLASVMGVAMIAFGYVVALSLDGLYAIIELVAALMMSILGTLCLLDHKRYLFYELSLVFISHFSILIAAIAVS